RAGEAPRRRSSERRRRVSRRLLRHPHAGDGARPDPALRAAVLPALLGGAPRAEPPADTPSRRRRGHGRAHPPVAGTSPAQATSATAVMAGRGGTTIEKRVPPGPACTSRDAPSTRT